MYKHLLVPTDGSELGTRAVMHSISLAKATGGKVTILTVLKPFHVLSLSPDLVAETPAQHDQHTREHIQTDTSLEEVARSSGVAYEHRQAESDHLHEAVLEAAAALDVDLLVIPAHERYGLLGGRALDSETVKVLTYTQLPVLVLH